MMQTRNQRRRAEGIAQGGDQNGPGTLVMCSRRNALQGAAASLAAWMLAPATQSLARQRAVENARDRRHAFADRLGDLTIPATDTPGATAAGVATFVLLALDHRMAGLEPRMLEEVHRALDQQAKGEFLQLPRNEQLELLTALDSQSYAPGVPAPGSLERSWRGIKAAIIAGYYTSAIGASKELVYDGVPGGFWSFKLTPDFRETSNEGFGGTLGG